MSWNLWGTLALSIFLTINTFAQSTPDPRDLKIDALRKNLIERNRAIADRLARIEEQLKTISGRDAHYQQLVAEHGRVLREHEELKAHVAELGLRATSPPPVAPDLQNFFGAWKYRSCYRSQFDRGSEFGWLRLTPTRAVVRTCHYRDTECRQPEYCLHANELIRYGMTQPNGFRSLYVYLGDLNLWRAGHSSWSSYPTLAVGASDEVGVGDSFVWYLRVESGTLLDKGAAKHPFDVSAFRIVAEYVRG